MARHFPPTERVLALGILLWAPACSAAGPDDTALLLQGERGPALLAFYGDTSAVDLQTSARVGELVILRFTSFGGGCISPDATEVEISGLHAAVLPYRREPTELPPNTACTGELRVDRHDVQLRFDRPGRAWVRIVGLARPEERSFAIERELQIVP